MAREIRDTFRGRRTPASPNPLLQTLLLANPQGPKRGGGRTWDTWCEMCGEWEPAKGPYHKTTSKGVQKTLCDLCYRGLRSGRRAGEPWAKRNGAYCEICDGPAYEAVVDDTGEHWLCPDHLKGWKLGPERIGMPSMPSRVRRGRRANPLTVAEGREISMEAVRMAQEAQGMPRPSLDELGDRLQARAFRAGRADGMVEVVKKYGPEFVRGAAPNPAVQAPPWKEGQKVPVAEARAWVVSTGDKELLRQFDEAAALQKKANRAPKHVIWQMLAIGSPRRMDAVTAMVQYGTSPETIYKPPAGSKKGSGLYRHEWGEGSGREKSVPVLAASSGKAIVMPLRSGQTVGDWMRG